MAEMQTAQRPQGQQTQDLIAQAPPHAEIADPIDENEEEDFWKAIDQQTEESQGLALHYKQRGGQ